MFHKVQALVALVILMGWAQNAGATDTRLQSMGGGHLSFTVMDESAVLLFRSTLALFPNTVYAEGGIAWDGTRTDTTASNMPYNATMGVHLQLTDDDSLAVYGSSLSRYVGSNSMGWAIGHWTQTQALSASESAGDSAVHNADHNGSII